MALTLGGMSYDPRLDYAGLRRVSRLNAVTLLTGFFRVLLGVFVGINSGINSGFTSGFNSGFTTGLPFAIYGGLLFNPGATFSYR